jgi:hypothetical protein
MSLIPMKQVCVIPQMGGVRERFGHKNLIGIKMALRPFQDLATVHTQSLLGSDIEL